MALKGPPGRPTQTAAIAEIAQTRDGQLRVKPHSKTAALDSLARHLRMFIDRSEITSTISLAHLDLSNLDDDELEALERITAKISGQDTNGSRAAVLSDPETPTRSAAHLEARFDAQPGALYPAGP